MTEDWTKWEGHVINGVFPLRRYINHSDHSGVFLSEYVAENLPKVALKLVPAIPTLTGAQLSHWTVAAGLSHPHLIRLFDSGRCQLAQRPYLFVVMEYSEQNLAEILPRRPLSAEEMRQTLLPVLDALAFLHGRKLVQGQLKPSNILLVDDQLKLASDTVRPAGDSTASIAPLTVYDPPEGGDGSFSTAGDIWSLGVTVFEALTQHPPAWPERGAKSPSLPEGFPSAFAGMVLRCLSRNPVDRPTAADLEAHINPPPQVLAAAAPQPDSPRAAPAERAAPVPVVPQHDWRKLRSALTRIAVILIAFVAVLAGLRMYHSHPDLPRDVASAPGTSPPPVSSPAADSEHAGAPTPVPPEAPSSSNANSEASRAGTPERAPHPSDQRTPASANASPSVLREVVPTVPRSARETIHGHIRVTVRVTVDSSGNVVGAIVENPGPSRYFARLAAEAARKWKFAPPDKQSARSRLLRFEFTREGASAHAAALGT